LSPPSPELTPNMARGKYHQHTSPKTKNHL
jgi:hypothetical protein